MIAVDTNIIVRLLVADDPDQVRRARTLVENATVLVQSSVLLEVEWVLRASYRLEKAAIHHAMTLFCRLEGIVLEQPDRILQALDWYARGFDFGDALHLAGSRATEAFYTFDGRFVALANTEIDCPPVRLP